MGDGWRVELQRTLHLGSPLGSLLCQRWPPWASGQTWVNEGNMAKEEMGVFTARCWCGVLGKQLQCHSDGLEGSGSSSNHTSALPGLQRFVWDTPFPGGGCGGLRVIHTSLFAAHIGNLLGGFKALKAPEPGVAFPLHHRETAEVPALCLTQLIAEQQEGV